MGQIKLTVSLILIGLFAFALIEFAVNFATDNSSPINILNDSDIVALSSDIQQNVSDFKSSSSSQYKSIVETTIGKEGSVAPSVGPFAITPLNVIGIIKNILKVGYLKIFGQDSGFGIFFTTFTGIILFMIGLYIYKSLRGFPD